MTEQDIKHDLVLQRFYSKNNKIKMFYVHVVVFFFFNGMLIFLCLQHDIILCYAF